MKVQFFNLNYRSALAMLFMSFLVSCSHQPGSTVVTEGGAHGEVPAADFPRGPHNGRLLSDGEFALEIAIFETGVPPEFHVWASDNGMAISPADVMVTATLTRLNVTDIVTFEPQDDYLRGTSTIYEPHSFSVTVDADYQGASHRWTYDSFEGRTTILPALSQDLGIETEIAGPAELKQIVSAVGKTVPNMDYTRSIHARFNGLVEEINVSLGDSVEEGQPLMVVESNESLKPYTINAPISGLVTHRNVNPGEQSDGRMLMEITDPTKVWAELAIFPTNRAAVQIGAMVELTPSSGGEPIVGTIASFAAELGAGQTLTARVALENVDGRFAPGTFVTANIDSGSIAVPLAVKREALQPFRDFTVVFAKVGNQYEVRMLELGRQDAEHIEVLGGLKSGTEYVTTNSYIIKADVEKSGASHDH